MKKLIIGLLTVFFFGWFFVSIPFLFAQNDWNRLRVKGPVKTVVVERADFKKIDDKWVEQQDRHPYFVSTYDRNGRLVEVRVANASRIFYVFNYTYNSKGDLIKFTEDKDNAGTKTKRESEYVYDKNGRLTEQKDKNYDENGFPSRRKVNVYDAKGNVIESKHYDEDNKYLGKFVRSYDVSGNLLEETYYDASGVADQKEIRRYDAKGRIVKEETSSNDFYVKTIYAYDAEGKKTVNSYGPNDVLQGTEIYDAMGNIVEETYYSNGAQIQKNFTTYEYDSQGNWTKRIHSPDVRDEKATAYIGAIEYHTITYF